MRRREFIMLVPLSGYAATRSARRANGQGNFHRQLWRRL